MGWSVENLGDLVQLLPNRPRILHPCGRHICTSPNFLFTTRIKTDIFFNSSDIRAIHHRFLRQKFIRDCFLLCDQCYIIVIGQSAYTIVPHTCFTAILALIYTLNIIKCYISIILVCSISDQVACMKVGTASNIHRCQAFLDHISEDCIVIDVFVGPYGTIVCDSDLKRGHKGQYVRNEDRWFGYNRHLETQMRACRGCKCSIVNLQYYRCWDAQD